ncbi:MAG TPA: adenosylcobinamide-phosphate synthase CbiB [Acetivibrio sp.]|nr:adenosylcobinamide-phosphate synthase CbiB [Acetivibrio sp.]
MDLYLLLDLYIAYVIEILIGFPRFLPHPVKFIRWLIKIVEKMVRAMIRVSSEKKVKALGDDVVRNTRKAYRNERIAGTLLALLVIAVVVSIVFGILKACMFVHPLVFHIVNTIFIYVSFASRSVAFGAFTVFDALKERDLFKARKMVTEFIGIKTEDLDESGMIKGTVEKVAKSTSDKVVAPVFYATIGSLLGIGAPMVFAYMTISILDSMVGHKNSEYKNIGFIPAKLDDIVNFIPARLTGLLVVVGAMLTGKNYKKGYSVMMRDRRKHKSPNFGYPEAAIAGVLGIRLGGPGLYFADIVDKPVIGDDDNPLDIKNITQTITIMYVTSIIAMVGLGAVAAAVVVLCNRFI